MCPLSGSRYRGLSRGALTISLHFSGASLITLAGLVLIIFYGGAYLAFSVIGNGGAERWVVYPSVLWVIGFGGYLIGAPAIAK
jgi:hypothetical protein